MNEFSEEVQSKPPSKNSKNRVSITRSPGKPPLVTGFLPPGTTPDRLVYEKAGFFDTFKSKSEQLTGSEEIQSFYSGLGLEVCQKVLVLPQDAYDHAQILVDGTTNPKVDGFFTPDESGVLVIRAPRTEEEYYRAIIAYSHELAHSSGSVTNHFQWEHKKRLFRRGSVAIVEEAYAKLGFASMEHSTPDGLKNSGKFLEEGFAQLMAKLSVQNLGLDIPIVPSELDASFITNNIDGTSEILPTIYQIPDKDGNKLTPPSSYAAYGLELLIAKDPEIFNSLIRARSDPDALRDFARRIRSQSPMLYSELYRLGDEPDFRQGMRNIIDQLYKGDEREALNAFQDHQKHWPKLLGLDKPGITHEENIPSQTTD